MRMEPVRQRVKVLGTKLVNLSLIPRSHMVERENRFHASSSLTFTPVRPGMSIYTYAHEINKVKQKHQRLENDGETEKQVLKGEKTTYWQARDY